MYNAPTYPCFGSSRTPSHLRYRILPLLTSFLSFGIMYCILYFGLVGRVVMETKCLLWA